MIGVSFFALAAESIHDLAVQARPRQSVAGLAVTAAAVVVMPSLAIAKRRTGQALGSRPDRRRGRECVLRVHVRGSPARRRPEAWLGWWWADPAAALVIAALAIREGVEAWREEN